MKKLNFIKKKIGWRDISFLMTLAICFFGLNVGYAQTMSIIPATDVGGVKSGNDYYVGAKTMYDVGNSGLDWSSFVVNTSDSYYVQVTITGGLADLEVTHSSELQSKGIGVYKTETFRSQSSSSRVKDFSGLGGRFGGI